MTNSNRSISIFMLVFLLAANTLLAQNHLTPGLSNDTMLFDGESGKYSPISNADGCKFKVTYIEGKVTGTTDRMEYIETCQGSWIHVTGVYELKEGDMVTGEIKTGDKARLELEAPDKSVIRLGPNSKTTLDCNAKFEEEGKKISMKLVLGTIWSHVTTALGGDKAMEVQTSRGVAGVRGTTFTYEVKFENGIYSDILRVFEGSVEFSGSLNGKLDEKEIAKRSKELQDDLKAGKISMEEFTQKIKELTDPAKDLTSKNLVMVDAGNESVIRGTEPPTSPGKYTETGDEWYLDKNFTR